MHRVHDRDLSLLDLKQFEEDLERSEGTKVENWDHLEMIAPIAAPNAPKLFAGSKILSGTISGMMEPGLYFGIHGAIISGKIAALAVTDPEGAFRDFKYFNREFKKCWYVHRYMNNPQRQYFFRFFFSYPLACTPFTEYIDKGVPGIDHVFANFRTEYRGTY